ncbi:MAG: hypothetical protein ACI9S8_000885, partial [Chlamydiales bacterium]
YQQKKTSTIALTVVNVIMNKMLNFAKPAVTQYKFPVKQADSLDFFVNVLRTLYYFLF